MSTQIRIDLDVKKELETLRDMAFRAKTHSDAIAHLINERVAHKQKIKELLNQIEEKKAKDASESITLGEARKKALVNLKEQLLLKSPNDVIDLLIELYHNSDKLDKATFLFYGDLMRK